MSRDEIAKRLWGPDVYIDLDAGIHTAILKIRQALDDSRGSARVVETVSGKGYRFIAPVEVVAHPLPCDRQHCWPRPHVRPTSAVITCPPSSRASLDVEKELLELPRVLTSSRLLSLTGAGGVGKTRLAVRLARGLVNEFADGVWLIDLAPLSVSDLVAQTIATALGVREGQQRSAREVLIETLRDRELLLVLDTCEHLIASCAELVEALLREAPALRIVATSREALGVTGETVYRVPSLSLPEAQASVSADALLESEATQLFVDRARAVDPAFTPTHGQCGRHRPHLPASRWDSPCHRAGGRSRRRALTGTDREQDCRTDSACSLAARERRSHDSGRSRRPWTGVISCCRTSNGSCSAGSRYSQPPWSLEAAEHVCGGDGINEHDVLDLLSQLVGKSLVVVDVDFRRRATVSPARNGSPVRARTARAGRRTPIGCALAISSSSSTSSVAHCRSFAITIN